jgi:putative membrane protein
MQAADQMFLLAAAAPPDLNPWAFQAHPEVWLLVGSIIALGLYVARVIAPKVPASVVGDGPAITRHQKLWFVAGVATLWFASDWPVHDVAEEYLYALHMFQHFLLTLVVPPMFWLATPPWLARLVIAPGTRAWASLRRLANPIVATVIFSVMTIATHWAVVVNTSIEIGPVHYLVHLTVVTAALIMWIPVVGPWAELRLTPIAQCIYLFVQSILPTVPGAWLTMANDVVYTAYARDYDVWGISAVTDQQLAGLFMKVGGGSFLWLLIIVIFFRWALGLERDEQRARIVTLADGLTYSDVADEFERLGDPPADPAASATSKRAPGEPITPSD